MLISAVAAVGAQPRGAIDAARRTADAASERNKAVAEQQAIVLSADQQAAAQRDSTMQPPAGGLAVPQVTAMPMLTREVYRYDGGGRRDPFLSLARPGGSLRPNIKDLRLVIAMVQPGGGRAIATILDKASQEQYVVKVGDSLGRYRVVQIDASSVTFAIEEFGFSRQEKLAISDTSKVRNQ
jgi:hypothetical protein